MRKNRLYIFPAFIPLVEILPWLLTAVGGLAGAVQFFRDKMQRRGTGLWTVVMVLCLITAGGIIAWQHHINPSEAEGTQMTATDKLPVLAVLGDIPPPIDVSLQHHQTVFGPLWIKETQNEMLSEPVITHGLYIAGTFSDTVEARNIETGALVWTLQKREPVFSGFAVSGNHVFVGEGLHTAVNSALTAFSVPDGTPLWQREFLGHLEALPRLSPDKNQLWVSAGPGGMWSLDMQNGAVLWRKEVGHMDCTPLALRGALYVAAQPDEEFKETILYKMNARDGKTDWTITLPGGTMGSPTLGLDETQILLSTAIGQVGPPQPTDKGWAYAVNDKGDVIWTTNLPGMPLPESSVVRAAGLVVLTTKSGELVALDMKDGRKRWSAKISEKVFAPAGLINTQPPLLAVMATDGLVSLRNALDGAELHRLFIGQGGYAAPHYANGVLYITGPRRIYAYVGLQAIADRAY